jgi:hypothetical protein
MAVSKYICGLRKGGAAEKERCHQLYTDLRFVYAGPREDRGPADRERSRH